MKWTFMDVYPCKLLHPKKAQIMLEAEKRLKFSSKFNFKQF